MEKKPGVGIIGVGTFGSLHASIYHQLDMCELKAIADLNQGRLDELCPALETEGYTDYKKLLERDDIDVVSICTTDELHVEPALAAARAGKHIFIEKPLAKTPQDCDRIIEAAAASGVKLTVGHILRFDPRYIKTYEEIVNGKIGELVHIFARRNNPIRSSKRLSMHTSVVFFLGIHDLDFLNWCVGTTPERVYAQAVSKVLEDTPDTVLALLSFPDGTIASLEVSWVLPLSFDRLDAKFEAVGTTGAIHMSAGRSNLAIFHERVEHPDVVYAPELLGERVGFLRNEITHWLKCVIHDTEPRVSPEDAKAAVVVACAIQESYERGSIVELA